MPTALYQAKPTRMPRAHFLYGTSAKFTMRPEVKMPQFLTSCTAWRQKETSNQTLAASFREKMFCTSHIHLRKLAKNLVSTRRKSAESSPRHVLDSCNAVLCGPDRAWMTRLSPPGTD